MDRSTKHIFILVSFLLCAAYSMPAFTQESYITITGKIKDTETGKALPYVNVSVSASQISTVSNADGRFTLKVNQKPSNLVFTHVGYRSRHYVLGEDLSNLSISMQPSTVILSEVVVNSGNPLEIIKAAIAKIPTNYSSKPELFKGFYRETTQRGRRYIYVAEAVVSMYKTSYASDVQYDRISIDKARRLISTRQSDTLGAKMQGGPVLPIYIDFVKNRTDLLNEEELLNYQLRMEIPTTFDNRPQIVIGFAPSRRAPYALYEGKVYIDRETLSFTRLEFKLDLSDRILATQRMLISKPAGVKFKPKEMSFIVSYKTEDGITRLNYVRSVSRFTCDWKWRLFYSPYTVVGEMVVTDCLPPDQVHPIKGKQSFDNRSSLYDKVELFDTTDFWGKDNIIEPTESLENAIDKLKEMLR